MVVPFVLTKPPSAVEAVEEGIAEEVASVEAAVVEATPAEEDIVVVGDTLVEVAMAVAVTAGEEATEAAAEVVSNQRFSCGVGLLIFA